MTWRPSWPASIPDTRDESPGPAGEHVRGDDQVRENFVRLHRDLAELRTELVDCLVQGSNVCIEWRLRGRREDGTLHVLAQLGRSTWYPGPDL